MRTSPAGEIYCLGTVAEADLRLSAQPALGPFLSLIKEAAN